MIKNSTFKRILTSFLLILCLFTLFSANVFANSIRPVYFKYRDGVVRDGAVGDRAGIIGDEDEAEKITRHHRTLPTSSLVGGNNNNINDNVLPRDNNAGDMLRTSDNASSADEESAMGVFWGIVIALMIAAAIILLVVLMTPKSTHKSK